MKGLEKNGTSAAAEMLFLKAAQAGDVNTLRVFIDQRTNVNARVDLEAFIWHRPPDRITDPLQSGTPLKQARGVEVVEMLIEKAERLDLRVTSLLFERSLRLEPPRGHARYTSETPK